MQTKPDQRAPAAGDDGAHPSPGLPLPPAALELLQPLLDALPFYVLVLDSAHRVLASNRAMQRDLKRSSRELLGCYCPREVHGLNEPFPGCPLEASVAEGGPAEREFFDARTGSWVESLVYPVELVTAEGRPVFVHFVRDITARKRLEVELRALKDGLERKVAERTMELEVRLAQLRELSTARRELSSLKALVGSAEGGGSGLIGRSAAMQKVHERLAIFAKASAPVLIVGETGTGKEMAARALHLQGPRRQEPFVVVACGAIPRELAESELLGHEKGAFTGATQSRRGCFERAHGGTLLLDDIDDLPIELQAKLLRVLQEGRFARVGGTDEIAVDVRVLATTKADLSLGHVRTQRFRDDLYYRLNGLRLHMPPLRERGEDIVLLATHFLALLATTEGQPKKRLSVGAADLLQRHPWPGNVRELRRAMESALVLCPGPDVTPTFLPEYLRGETPDEQPLPFALHLDQAASVELPQLTEQFQQAVLDWAQEKAGGNLHRAAKILGVPRSTLQSKLKRTR
ncbi:MAG: sigma 54-interacting transcriptional regulator [Deltaproteobacteria bacterium]|nr:sigma 54-interacting transcriptional regulator [Deltaproteobacteria bacterium]